MKVLVAVSLVPALRNGALFQKPVTNCTADIALSCEKICSVFEDSSIKTKYRKTFGSFLARLYKRKFRLWEWVRYKGLWWLLPFVLLHFTRSHSHKFQLRSWGRELWELLRPVVGVQDVCAMWLGGDITSICRETCKPLLHEFCMKVPWIQLNIQRCKASDQNSELRQHPHSPPINILSYFINVEASMLFG
jgi:hypothetical protein